MKKTEKENIDVDTEQADKDINAAKEKKTYSQELSIENLEEMGACIGSKKKHIHETMLDYVHHYSNTGDSIIDSKQLITQINLALDLVAKNINSLWFVGNEDKYISTLLHQKCTQSDIPHIKSKWIPGYLSNWSSTKSNIGKLIKKNIYMGNYTDMKIPATLRKTVKNFVTLVSKQNRFINNQQPELLIIFDSTQHAHAIKEAISTNTPVIVITDTDSDIGTLIHQHNKNTIIIPFNLANIACINFIIDLFINTIANLRSQNAAKSSYRRYNSRRL